MRKITLSEIFNKQNVNRVIAVLMVLTMIFAFAACNNNEDDNPSSTPSTPSENVSSNEDVSSEDNSSEEDTESDDSSKTTYISPLDGDIYVSYDYDTTLSRTDLYEVEPVVDPANLSTKYVGYAEEERNELRDEILNTENTLELYKVKGTVYYVSTSGNDNNDGKSPKTALRTLAGLGVIALEPGDAVLFERGCIFRMYEPFYCQTGITYGSYGKGSKPMFVGSPENFAKAVWTPSKKKNVWQTSYMYAYASGAFFNQGEECGYMKSAIGDLNKNTDFFCDTENSVVYIYCDKGNPSKVWESIELSQSGIRVEIPTRVYDVTFDNICIRFCGEGGIRGEYLNHDITITNCEIGYVGGAWHDTVRYGNGIELWCGGWNLNWSHNWIYQTFDSGISPQSNVGGDVVNMDNIVISNNLMEFNNADIEFWEHGCEAGLTPSRFKDWYVENNICRFTSLGWGTRADDGGIRGIDGVFFGRSSDNAFINVNWRNNIIDCPGRQIYKFTISNKEQYDGWTRENNTYYIKQSLRTTDDLAIGMTVSFNDTTNYKATTEEATIAAFAEFEPGSKVYWYRK